jgi:ABC-type Na+ transport system ATPase subunit NatA
MVRARRPRSGSGPTLLTPDRGTITIAGRDVLREPSKVRSKIGLAGQSVTMDEYLSGLQNLIMIGRLYRFSRKDARRRGLQAHRAVRARRRCEPAGPDIFGRHASRLGLAASLVAAPPVLFLDEPTAGLDPERPRGLEGFAANQPMSQAIDATRALLLGQPVGDHVWVAVVWCVGITVVSATAAGILFRRKLS